MKPRNRDGKRQLMSFIPLSLKQDLRRICLDQLTTYQSLAATGVNLFLSQHNIQPFMADQKKKLSLRNKGLASPKTTEQTSATRIGKVTFGGWYKAEMVFRLEQVAKDLNMTLQEIMEQAAQKIIERYRTA